MKNRYLIALCALLLSTIALSGCHQEPKKDKAVIIATIAPIKQIVEMIVEDSFEVAVLVDPGASPETFDPSPRQYIELNEASMVFGTGLIDFEQSILQRISDKSRLVNLSEGIELIAGSCSHNHAHAHTHHHGVDPHIWTSPIELQIMAQNCYAAISKAYPDSLHYHANYLKLQSRLEGLDTQVTGQLLASGIKSFVIHHPAYTYFARDYGIEQVAIEDEGKDPSARRIGEIIDRARQEGVAQILYQDQFPASVVDVIASDIKAEAVAVDPLSEDIISHIEEFATIITTKR